MRCTICHRPSSSALPFNCTACARDTLYQTRISIAHALLEHEAAGSQVEQTLKTFPSTQIKLPALASSIPQLHPPSLALDSTSVHREAVSQQNQLMLQGSKLLREEAARIRDEIASRKDRNLARKIELIAARKELARREAVDVASPEKAAARVRNRWDTLHNRTAESRLVLCKEAASLYGLEKQSTCDAGLATDVYFIGGLPIYNLKDLNNASPTIVTTVNSTLAHLIHLTSHYLSLRLPAEIVLPHRDNPFPIILHPGSSHATAYSPYSIAITESPASPRPSAVRDTLHANQTKTPKPLNLKKNLSTVAKEDSQTYATVVEGVTLLAWDIAWLCKTQGIDIGADSWDEVCDVGANLWKLFAAEQAKPRSTSMAHSSLAKQDIDVRAGSSVTAGRRATQHGSTSDLLVSFGQYSHGTVHSNLSTAIGRKIMRGWRLQDPAKVIERVKQMLLGDRTGAGWDMLEGKEWEIAAMIPEHLQPAAPVNASTVVVDSTSGYMDTTQDLEVDLHMPNPADIQAKAKGTSGWTKLKSR